MSLYNIDLRRSDTSPLLPEASVVVPSAEGETWYQGRENDRDRRVGRWLDVELAKLGQRHAFNAEVR